MSRRAGFTVGEVLFAMVIIIIGGGLVLANCERGYRSARAAACTSNVKQLTLSLRMYCTDWDAPPRDARDFAALQPYTRNYQVFVCPAQREPAGKISMHPPGAPDDARADYLMNPHFRLDDNPATLIAGDDQPARHMHRYWVGGRLDGACFLWPAAAWETKLGAFTGYEPPPMQ